MSKASKSAWERARQRVKNAFKSKKQLEREAEMLKAPEGVIAGYTVALHSNGRAELILLRGTSAFQALALHGMATMRLHDQIRANDEAVAREAAEADAAGKACCDLMVPVEKAPGVVDCPTHGRRRVAAPPEAEAKADEIGPNAKPQATMDGMVTAEDLNKPVANVVPIGEAANSKH